MGAAFFQACEAARGSNSQHASQLMRRALDLCAEDFAGVSGGPQVEEFVAAMAMSALGEAYVRMVGEKLNPMGEAERIAAIRDTLTHMANGLHIFSRNPEPAPPAADRVN